MGYFGIGIYHTKTEANVGTLWRSAFLFNAAFVFTIGRRYSKQASDTQKTWRSIPLWHFTDIDDWREHTPYDCQVVGVELAEGAIALPVFRHPKRAIYLLGAEDHGLPPAVLTLCQYVVQIPTGKPYSMNVATAGSILMYDRFCKEGT